MSKMDGEGTRSSKRLFPGALSACLACTCLVLALASGTALADEWPTYMKDSARSGVTSESLNTKFLTLNWTYSSPVPPRIAWDGGAPWDAWRSSNAQNACKLTPMRDFDFVLFVTAAESSVFFGSSVTDSVHCLDRQSGKEKWFHTANGPVRYPPTIAGGKLYFGSDDGFVSCIDPVDGSLIWKYSPSGRTRLIGNNGSLIPLWPVRTGTAVQDGKVYFAASLVNWETSYLCAVDALTGSDSLPGCYKVSGGVTPMGAIMVSPTKIYLLQGRQYPYVFDRATGSLFGQAGASGNGGCFALLTADSSFLHGHAKVNDGGHEVREFNADTLDKIATHPGARQMVVSGNQAYMVTHDTLFAMQRSGSTIWSKSCDCPFALILAGDILFAGGTNVLRAYSISDGTELWSHAVKGRVRGLAAAEGNLYASTDTGRIYAFGRPLFPARPFYGYHRPPQPHIGF